MSEAARSIPQIPRVQFIKTRYRIPVNGSCAEVDVIQTTVKNWIKRPESLDPRWRVVRFGPFLQAVRLSL